MNTRTNNKHSRLRTTSMVDVINRSKFYVEETKYDSRPDVGIIKEKQLIMCNVENLLYHSGDFC